MVIPAHKVCKRARVCSLVCLCGWLHTPLHLSFCSPIHYPQHLAPKACKRRHFSWQLFFKGSDTGDSQPQEPHIFQSTCILRTACITEPPQSPSLSISLSLALSQNTHKFFLHVPLTHSLTHTRYCSHPPLSLCNILTQALRANRFQSQSCPTNCASSLSVHFAP